MGATCSRVDCPDYVGSEDVADPDILGFGVLVAFIMPAFFCNAMLTVAYLSRTLPDDMYAHFDDKLVSKLNSVLKRRKRLWKMLEQNPKIWTWMRMVRYEALLLTISDQDLVTSIVILVAMYSQICSISNLSFQIAITLSYFATSVHALTLTALKGYFAGRQLQAKIRLGSMVFITIIQIASVFFSNIVEGNSLSSYVICDIIDAAADWKDIMWASFAESWFISYGLYTAFFNIYEPDSQCHPVHAWVLAVLRRSYRDERFQEDKNELVRQEEQRQGQSRARQIRTLQQHPDRLLTKLRIVIPAIAIDFSTSTFWMIFGSTLFTVWSTELFGELLLSGSSDGIEISSLLEPTFGQLLPILLLLVFVFNFMEASGVYFYSIAVELSADSGFEGIPNLPTDVPLENKSQASDTSSMSDDCAESSQEMASSEKSPSEGPALNQRPAVAVDSTSTGEQDVTDAHPETINTQLDHFPSTTSNDLNHEIEPQGRTDTLQREEGGSEMASFDELMEAVYNKAPRYSRIFVFATLAAQVCFFVALFFFFVETVSALFCLKTSVVLKRIVLGFRGFRRVRKERMDREAVQRQEDEQRQEQVKNRDSIEILTPGEPKRELAGNHGA